MSREAIRLGQRLADGLYGLISLRDGEQLWSIAKLRKSTNCAICDMPMLRGSMGYRPITNAGNRMCRLCQTCVDAIVRMTPK